MTLEELLRQGKSFGQGASNSAASTVTGPVDMLAWLLRKGGVPVGDTPIGGEAWMRQKGLMATPENKLAGLLGEGAGLAAPIVAAAKAPEIAGGLLQMGRNLATPQTLNKQAGQVFVYPQEKALAIAQKNAALPIEKGGLGLHPNNTAAERAKAMGFDTEGIHTSRHGIDTNVLDSGKYAMSPFDAVGTHFGTKEAALDRFNRTVGTTEQFKGSTYPALLKGDRPYLDPQGKVYTEDPISNLFSSKADYGNLPKSNAALREEVFKDHSIIPYINDVEAAGSTSYIAPPQNIRSRFAAFDPARRNEADLLGRADPKLLSLLAAGGLLGTAGYNKAKAEK